MPDYEILKTMAEECGFTHSAPLAVSTLDFMQEVRDMCNARQCNKYNTSWSCPPACGSLQEMRELAAGCSYGILVQTVGEIEDSYDWEGIKDTEKRHKENFGRLLYSLERGLISVIAMGAGACKLCQSCTYPDAPCRFPDRMTVSMEACGLLVSKVCTDNGLAYNYGPGRIAFTSCFLLRD